MHRQRQLAALIFLVTGTGLRSEGQVAPRDLTANPPRTGVRGVYYADNWEDAEGFQPYVFVGVADEMARWREPVMKFEFVGGTISSFRYLDYYEALATVRGAISGKGKAQAFDIDVYGKRRVLDQLP